MLIKQVFDRGYLAETLCLERREAARAVLERPSRCVQRGRSLTSLVTQPIDSSFTSPVASRSTSRGQTTFTALGTSEQVIQHRHITIEWTFRVPHMLS